MDALLANTKPGISQSSWFQYWDFDTGKSDSQYPDNPFGTVYMQNDWATVDNWTSVSSSCSLATNSGLLVVSASVANFAISRSGFSFSGSANRFVIFRMRQTGGVAYSTSVYKVMANSGSISKRILGPENPVNWNTFVVDMSSTDSGSWIGSTITDIRIDPVDDAGDSSCVIQFDWIYVGDGTYANLVPIIYGDRQDEQQAAVAAFTNLGSVPAIPEVGVDWTGAMTGDTSFGEIDSQINTAISNCGLNYYPKYTILNGNLKVTINKAGS